MRGEALTTETGSSAIKSVGLVNQALAMEIRCNCRMSKRGPEEENQYRTSLRQSGSSKGDGGNREWRKLDARFFVADLNRLQRLAADGIWILVGIARIRGWAAH